MRLRRRKQRSLRMNQAAKRDLKLLVIILLKTDPKRNLRMESRVTNLRIFAQRSAINSFPSLLLGTLPLLTQQPVFYKALEINSFTV